MAVIAEIEDRKNHNLYWIIGKGYQRTYPFSSLLWGPEAGTWFSTKLYWVSNNRTDGPYDLQRWKKNINDLDRLLIFTNTNNNNNNHLFVLIVACSQ